MLILRPMTQPPFTETPPNNEHLILMRSDLLAWRILRLLNYFRCLVPMLLGGFTVVLSTENFGMLNAPLFFYTLISYGFFALLSFVSLNKQWPSRLIQTFTQLLADVLAISLLTYASGGMSSGLAELLILPVAASPLVLRKRPWGLAMAAISTLALLFQQAMVLFHGIGDAGELTSTALLSALMFILNFGVSYGFERLKENEALISQRDIDIANLAELNEFIVHHLRESILVVDEQDRIRLINESASQLLNNGPVKSLTPLGDVSPRLLQLLNLWRSEHIEATAMTASLVSGNGATLIQPHFVALANKHPGPTLIFLEDTSIVTERIKQSKLAALGHLSASIAHEIRNPVGAMSHAAQLLFESPNLQVGDQRLCSIISKNSERVSTIINNVLQLSRREFSQPQVLLLNDWINEFSLQFRNSHQLNEHQFQIEPPEYAVTIKIDPSHLNQIVSNLCDNAINYGRKHSIDKIELRYGRIAQTNRPFLEIADRGPGIAPEHASRIFEPFFTTGEQGTGLGLFIARELCHCNRALLIYEARQGGGSIFRIVFSDPQRWEE